jgi:hypothetical protein
MTSCCPIPGCMTPRRPGHLMCKEHWQMVPFAQQRAVNKAWRAVFDRRASLAESRDLIEAHTREKEAAIRMVVKILTPVVAA